MNMILVITPAEKTVIENTAIIKNYQLRKLWNKSFLDNIITPTQCQTLVQTRTIKQPEIEVSNFILVKAQLGMWVGSMKIDFYWCIISLLFIIICRLIKFYTRNIYKVFKLCYNHCTIGTPLSKSGRSVIVAKWIWYKSLNKS